MRALVLSGGGARGAYQIGVLQKVMKDEGRDYDLLCGVSVGAINAAGLAQFPKGSAAEAWGWLHDLWLTIDNDKIFERWLGWPLSVVTCKASVYDTEPLRKLILDNLNEASVRTSGKLLRVGAVSWNTGEYKLATERHDNLGWWVAASAAYPVVFEPVRIGGNVWTDGGARNVTPLRSAIELGAKEIDVVMASNPDLPSNWDPEGKLTQHYLFRYLGISSDEIIRTDLKCLGVNNPFVELKPEYADVNIRVQQPRNSVLDSLEFSPENIRAMIKQGYKEAYKENF